MLMDKKFKYVSLFSGIGGFEQALNRLGGTCVMASEIDKFAEQAYQAIYGQATVGDITKVKAEDVPDHDLLVGGFPCFAKGTLITTDQGLKAVEDIRKGDKVLTHTNTFKKVNIPMVKKKRGIYELKVAGSPLTYITEEHPVYVREMKRVWDNEKRSYVREWSEPKWVEAKDLKPKKHFVGMSENKESANPYEITSEEAWLIGRYVADGYIRNNKRGGRKNSYNNQIIYCVGKKKLSEFKKNVETYYLGVSEERTVYKCRIINKRLMNLCLEAGRGSENKRIPGYILDLPNTLLERFLDGYISGDGSKKDGQYRATSVSRELIYGLGQVVQKLYNTPYSITFTKRPKTTVIEGRTVNQRDTWTISFRKENRKQQDGVYIDGMLWMPIRSKVYDHSFDDFVYNFEVDGDNSYVANNLTVHNCQSFSVAGKRKGFEDTRGTMFFEIARIAKEKRPKALLLENVKGLINHDKGNTLDVMIRTLNDIGYIIDFNVLNSKYFGVPQNRERVFIVAIREDLIESEPFSEESMTGNTIVPKRKRQINEWAETFNFDWPQNDEVTTRLRDILESNVDEKYYLDEEKTAKLVAQLEGKENDKEPTIIDPSQSKREGKVRSYQGVSSTITARIYKEPHMLGHLDMKGNDQIKRVYSAESVGPTLTTMGGGHREPKIAEEVRPVLTPEREVKRQNGRRIKDDGEESFTLTAQDHHGIAVGEYPKYRIRKLTPRECWRLQNFPDDVFDKVKAVGLSDSQLYKQAGNAVTVSVVDAIGERLITYL